ncbi:MAG TPA: hypothetical protein VGM37_17415 [Armatimonadota bacterium]
MTQTHFTPGEFSRGVDSLYVADYGNHRVLGYRCSTTLPLQYGDVNGDGFVNVDDASALLSILGGMGGTTVLQMSDVAPSFGAQGFGDSRLDLTDASRLLRYISGLEPGFPR